MKGLVLAGGEGTRLRPFTHSGAKQLVPVANRPVLFHVIDRLAAAGVDDVVVLVAPATGAEVRAAVGDGGALGVRATYVVQERPLGLAHAVATARCALGDEPFVVMLGDNVIGAELGPAVRRFAAGTASAALWLAEVDDPRAFGVAVVGDDGRVRALLEKPAAPPSRLALVGVYLFRPRIFEAIARIEPSSRGELEITDAVNALLAAGEDVVFERLEGFWLDTGKKDDLLRANEVVLDAWIVPAQRGVIDATTLLVGPVRVEPGAVVERSQLVGPCVVGRGATVVDSVVGPHVALGDGARVARSRIARSVLLEGAVVEDAGTVRDAVVGRRAIVRRRAGAELALAVGDDGVVELPAAGRDGS